MKSSEIRKAFLDFFKKKDHLILPSSSLVPDDPTLLLTAAGMVQFKPYFLNLAEPPHKRIATVQKCVRTSDIERVGETARHLTFFEMLGNFSFGDYYKKEAIGFAFEFLFDVLKLDRDDFWVTVYEEDDETYEIWSRDFGFPEERIVRLGKEDNFWEAGPVGPCGPCSELIVDRGEKYGCQKPDCKPGCDCDRFLEIWNLVFMQFNRNEDGSLTPLPKKNIDTGMGLERISLLMQQVSTVFETDLLFPIVSEVSALTGVSYGSEPSTDRSLRIIADHLKASAFLLADGVIPSNEGRGYILRRLIRRSLSHLKKLGYEGVASATISERVISLFGDIYPEVSDNREFIINMISAEERRFLNVLERGLAMLEDELKKLRESQSSILSGYAAFKLYDTYGFPVELTVELASEEGFGVDLDEFNKLVEESRKTSRESWKAKKYTFDARLYDALVKEFGQVDFTGYFKDEDEADLIALIKGNSVVDLAEKDEEVDVILNQTPFYPEGGGQIGDRGVIYSVDGEFEIEISDTQQPVRGMIVHRGRVTKGTAKKGSRVKASIDRLRRRNTERNHTSTHLLHWALRVVLGEGVKQSGSFVGPDYFRFDFPLERPLSNEEMSKIERLVNQKIAEAHPVRKYETTIDYARQIGAIALFGEKYGEKVRVVEIGDFSRELCGGTHVNSTSEISVFLIRSERSIGSGLRRIEAITGARAIEEILEMRSLQKEIEEMLDARGADVKSLISVVIEENEKLKNMIQNLNEKGIQEEMNRALKNAVDFKGVKLVRFLKTGIKLKDLKELVDRARSQFDEYAVVAGTVYEGKPSFFVALSEGLVKKGLNASEVARRAAKVIGGGGGGSNRIADAGGKDPEKIEAALEEAVTAIKELLQN